MNGNPFGGYSNSAYDYYSEDFNGNGYGTTEHGLSDFCNSWDNIIEPYDRTLTFIITNAGAAPATAILFGAYENAAQPAGVTVTVAESSHAIVRATSMSDPFLFWGMKYVATDVTQLSNPLQISRTYETGAFSGGVYQPRNYTNPTNFNDKMIDDPTFRLAVDGRTKITFSAINGVTTTLIFTIKSRGNVINTVKGKPQVQISGTPRPSGNSVADTQVQLLKLRSRAMAQAQLGQ
jgi:hypothetical protein